MQKFRGFVAANVGTLSLIASLLFVIVVGVKVITNRDVKYIAVILSGDIPTTRAIREFVQFHIDEFNGQSQSDRPKVRVEFYDDDENPEKAGEIALKLKEREDLLAVVGSWNSTRASRIVPYIGPTGVPFVGDFSNAGLFHQYPNVFSMAGSIKTELKMLDSFLKVRKPKSVVFIGRANDQYTDLYSRYLRQNASANNVHLCRLLSIQKENVFNEENVDRYIRAISDCKADLVFVSLGSKENGELLERFVSNGITSDFYTVLGTFSSMFSSSESLLESHLRIYDLSEKGIPDVANERLEKNLQQILNKVKAKELPNFTYGAGARYSDAVNMVLEGIKGHSGLTTKEYNKRITDSLWQYVDGAGIYRGLSQDWSFLEDRTSAEQQFFVWKRKSGPAISLLPNQFILGEENTVVANTIYMSLDIDRISRIDRDDKKFNAEFYFNLFDPTGRVSIDDIEFTNAAASSTDNKPLLRSRRIDTCKVGELCQQKRYRVSGQFDYFPDLRKYPFDFQAFTISFQALDLSKPIFIQPPRPEDRDEEFTAEGWSLKRHYVGFDQDVVTHVDDYATAKKVEPIYKFNFTWELKRDGVEFYTKILVPITVILITAFLTSFMRFKSYDAIATVQVTCLLAAIALYFAVEKPNVEYATITDLIFISVYTSISFVMLMSIVAFRLYDDGKTAKTDLAILISRVGYVVVTLIGISYSLTLGYKEVFNVG